MEHLPTDYRGFHSAPGPGAGCPLHDLDECFPDIYDIDLDAAVQYYGYGGEFERLDAVTVSLIWSVRDLPATRLKVYRAVPRDVRVINPGDWVTVTRDYAKIHGEGPLQGNFRIISMTVQAGQVYNNGDSIHEYGYCP